jgi:ATP-binding cassette subfamily C protein CydD
VVISCCSLASAVLLAHIVSGIVTDPASRSLGRWSAELLLLAAVFAARTAAQWLQSRLSQRGASGAIADLSGQVLRSVTAADPRILAERRDDAAAVVLRGLDGLRPYFIAYLPALILAVILTPAALLLMAFYDLQATAIVLVALPLIPIFMVLIGLATAERSAAALTAMTTLQARMLDLIAGIPTLRALGRARGPAGRIAELSAAHHRSAMATLRIAFLSALVLELLATLGVALVAVSVGLRLVYGDLELVTALTVLLLAPDVFWPLRRVGVEFHAAQDGKAAADRAFELIDQAPTQPAATRTVNAARAAIRVDDLSVTSRSGNAPHHLDAVFEPGLVTVLTGPNGAGKSTTLQAVTGMTPAASGRVTVGGIAVEELEPGSWWAQLSWLPQRPVLVPGTVADNLALFGPLMDPDSACAAAGFDRVLTELPDGADTILGRGGVGLSLGQRQRLGLARALGSSAPVLLLDEPTAHLDAATEQAALAALVERARRGATVVVVGHRAPVLAIADRVITVTGTEVNSHVAV